VCDSGLPSWIACMLREIGSGVLLYKSIRLALVSLSLKIVFC
jgi:hypothetical protein